MPPEPAPVLIVKSPGRVRDGLCSLLSHQPHIRLVGAIHAEQALLQLIAARTWTGVVLLDTDFLGPDTLSWFRRQKLQTPSVRWILLVDTISQQTQALAGGANEVLIKGFSADELVASIRRVLATYAQEAKALPFAAPTPVPAQVFPLNATSAGKPRVSGDEPR